MVVHRFGPFELDSASRRLYCGRKRVRLSDAESAILLLLVSRAGDIVSIDALIEAAWGNAPVNENSLRQAIRRIRQALEAKRKGVVFIETLRGHGFRFAVAVQRAEREAPPGSLEDLIAPHRAFVLGQTALDSFDVDAIHRARRAFEEAIRRAPEYAEAHVGLATACALAFEATAIDPRPDTASLQCGIEHARRGCALAPSSGEAFSTLALVLFLNGETEDATFAACKAATLDPDNGRHHLRLGYVSWGDQRLRAAGRLLALGIAVTFAHWLRATVFIARGAFEMALEELRLGCAAQDAEPKGSRFSAVGLHLLRGLVYAYLGRLDDAVEEFNRELSWADSGQLYARECGANAWYALGAVRLRQGKRDAAHLAFARALTIAPCHASALAALQRTLPPSAKPIDVAIHRAIALALGNRHADAARVYCDTLMKEPPGPGGWLLPVEPLLNASAHPEIWADALVLVRVRAT
jgi:DNA-binding winged helix-turn-helix (wHTH) protein/cytochrome c-type biogenesis protein CcmH/NrfG